MGADEDVALEVAAKLTDESLPWVEKYRPKSMDQLVAHEEIISTINALISANKLPHLLFYGPPGTGKTSTILACAHQMYTKSYSSMVLELNASDDRGIDVVRERIKDFAGTKQMFSHLPKLIVLDEADAMTNPAQMALRRVMEKFTRNARFCLICNYGNKIIPALQSRCTRFRFAPLSAAQATSRTTEIAEAEGVEYTADGIEACVSLGHGDMRRCLNVLQSTAMSVRAERLPCTVPCADCGALAPPAVPIGRSRAHARGARVRANATADPRALSCARARPCPPRHVRAPGRAFAAAPVPRARRPRASTARRCTRARASRSRKTSSASSSRCSRTTLRLRLRA